MEKTVCKRARTVHFWDGYAKWFKLWIEHSDYHDKIIKALMTMVKPGWKILDIGAGNGILSLPLCAIGCDVRAIEPSTGMRSLLHEDAGKRGIDWINREKQYYASSGRNSGERAISSIILSSSPLSMPLEALATLSVFSKIIFTLSCSFKSNGIAGLKTPSSYTASITFSIASLLHIVQITAFITKHIRKIYKCYEMG